MITGTHFSVVQSLSLTFEWRVFNALPDTRTGRTEKESSIIQASSSLLENRVSMFMARSLRQSCKCFSQESDATIRSGSYQFLKVLVRSTI